jgi:hypothetical protein
MFAMRELKQCLNIPVLPKDGAGWYLEGAVFDHSNDLEENSNLATRIKTPKNLCTSPGVVAAFSDVNVTIIASWSGRKIIRK